MPIAPLMAVILIYSEIGCAEFKLRIENFSTNAQTTSPRSADPALPCNPNE
ncbi:hypothetical protein MICAG_1650002 [Microcystis aeruginosa PCC 9808]|uniref:Uncharacterized protein n=1 Tax=Microcystis aeruginosa PCC 9808 TaxID=1160284 RepID=I4HJD2_MICAE|nr:hypothetical protein MICAG_1650002 [Microcystis aeruginosa PCC 9808]